jgi:hypothetical protein
VGFNWPSQLLTLVGPGIMQKNTLKVEPCITNRVKELRKAQIFTKLQLWVIQSVILSRIHQDLH